MTESPAATVAASLKEEPTRPVSAAQPAVEVSIEPSSGWHVSHLFYAFDRARLAALSPATRGEGARLLAEALDPLGPQAPLRLQTWIVPGQKADFGIMAMDASPL